MSLDNRPHEYYIDANCEQMKNHSADFCLPGRQSLTPLHGSVWRGFQGGQPHPCLVATNGSLPSVMGNDQRASTSPWQLSPCACSCWQLQPSTCSYKVMFALFSKRLFMFMLPFVSVSLWYSNSNAECTLEYCPRLRWILFSLLTVMEKLSRLFPVLSHPSADDWKPWKPKENAVMWSRQGRGNRLYSTGESVI